MNMKHQYNAALKATNTWLEVARPERQETAVIRPVQVRGKEVRSVFAYQKAYATHPLTQDKRTWDTAWFGQYE
jgi:hypothetical protein